ncbi:MAG TPA: 50S ribosomal protein L10 [Acidimicrobiales bacterium]|nr:50S ribosomal protein L10 [Acidimicrobiales bacterium]
MENPRPEKVAVVNEVRERLEGAQASILTEYRGLTVREMAELRQALTAVGGDYKVYKNTLVKLAIAGGRHEPLAALLEGPTAIAFVSGEVSAVAKALRDYARSNSHLIVKGGLHGEGFLSAQELGVLADLPSRDVLLARLAGAIAAPLQQFAGLLEALPRSLAYGLSALLDQKGGAPAEAEAAAPEAEAAAPEAEAPATEAEAPASEAAAAEVGAEAPAPEAEVPAAEVEAEAPAPVAEATAAGVETAAGGEGADESAEAAEPAETPGEGDGT